MAPVEIHKFREFHVTVCLSLSIPIWNVGDRGEVGVGWDLCGWGDYVRVFVE